MEQPAVKRHSRIDVADVLRGFAVMGIVLLPTSTSNEAMITLSTTDTLSKDESYDVAGKVVQAVMAVDGVEEVGITPANTVAGMDVSNLGLPSTITDLLNAANGYGKYKINVKLNEELSSSKIDAACKAMEDAVAGGAGRAATRIQVALRAASPTILAWPASADWTSRIIR